MSDRGTSPETENLLPVLETEPRRRGLLLVRVGIMVATAGLVLAGAISGYAYVFGGTGTRSALNGNFASDLRRAATTTTERPTTTTKPKPTTTTLPKQEQPPLLKLPPVPGGTMGIGSRGPEVQMYELRLKQLHFDPGPVDGYYDSDTAYAVTAVEKMFGGTRDGRVGEAVRFALSTFKYPEPLIKGGEPDRVEIDLVKQVLTLYRNNQVALITTTSTGSGKHFCGGDDGCQYAVTPPGKFAFDWHYNGWRNGSLGHLYNPYYFNGGIAVHGYTSVPPYPASHGCARIPMHIADYFPTMVFKGMPVYVVGPPAATTGAPTPPATAAPAPPTVPPTAAPVTAATTPTTAPKPTTPSSTPRTTAPKPTSPSTSPATTAPKPPASSG